MNRKGESFGMLGPHPIVSIERKRGPYRSSLGGVAVACFTTAGLRGCGTNLPHREQTGRKEENILPLLETEPGYSLGKSIEP